MLACLDFVTAKEGNLSHVRTSESERVNVKVFTEFQVTTIALDKHKMGFSFLYKYYSLLIMLWFVSPENRKKKKTIKY